ncbi:hypothetical protein ACF1GT_32280 [Streptomyces sp. NPDC014636]|uniref:hypothetical protein n=1 Tax=Streptomyces sp. NPDC014636 TaxID=3364876 RepID=UPI0036FD8EC2
MGALLMTELGHGNSNTAVRTEAVYDPATREFVLTTPGPEAVKYPPSVACPGLSRTGIVTAKLVVDGQDREIALESLLRRFPSLRLDMPAEEVPRSSGRLIHGVTSLPVAW